MEQRVALLGDFENTSEFSASNSNSSSDDGATLSTNHFFEKLDEQDPYRFARLWQYRAIIIALIISFVIFGIGSAMKIIFLSAHATSSSMGECGRTSEQARQNGCVFDLMMSGWVHPPCYNQELSDRFLSENNFAFFWDQDGLKPLTEAEARLGNHKFIYTNGTFHYQHCAYIWAKQISARKRSPFVLDSQSRSIEHVEHCIQRVGNPNITQVALQTGTRLHVSTWRLDCITGEREVHTNH